MNDDKKIREFLAELIDLMNQNELAELEVEDKGSRIRLRKAEKKPEPPVIISAPGPARESSAEPVPPAQQGEQAPPDNLLTIRSPMVGTFYRAPSPDAEPFVEPGDTVTEETVVCIIEAMKVMNEIKSECDGRIKEILVVNGEPVEYGQPLFLVEPA